VFNELNDEATPLLDAAPPPPITAEYDPTERVVDAVRNPPAPPPP
jgi:hypothetical protein